MQKIVIPVEREFLIALLGICQMVGIQPEMGFRDALIMLLEIIIFISMKLLVTQLKIAGVFVMVERENV